MPVRERVFGGTAGFWLRRRKKNLPANSGIKPTDSDNVIAKDEYKQQFHIGWDEERCRPVYASASSTQTSSTSSDEEEESEKQIEEESTRVPTRSAITSFCDDKIVNQTLKAVNKRSSFGNMKPRKPRSTFGSRKRWTLLDFDEESVPKRVRVSDMSKSTVDDTNNEIESFGLMDGVRDPLAENEKLRGPAMKRSKRTLSEDSASKEGDASVFEFNGDENDNQIELSQVGHPTSKTSLTVARAFFEQLDTNCALTLDSSQSPDVHKANIRTRRKVSLDDPGLVEEYKRYCTSCKDANVGPLSIQHFLAYRSNAKTTLYDGFLDE